MSAPADVLKNQNLVRAYALTIGIILLSLAFANVAHANEQDQVTRQFLTGTGLLCYLPPDERGAACPDVSSASNGDTVTITGSGSFTPGDDDAEGGGTFTHTSATGTVLAQGTWEAEELVSFVSFGSGSAQNLPANTEGGIAVLNVELRTTSGVEVGAVLVIHCALGTPPAGSLEGITLNAGFINFDTPVSGFTVFIQVAED